MRILERDTPEWHKAWGALAAALREKSLPDEGGGTVRCSIDDFMLVGMDNNGVVHFKNIGTRRYVLVEVDGTLLVPAGSFFLGERGGPEHV